MAQKQKTESIEELYAEIISCKKCRLWENAKNAVPGDGNTDSSLMFIGEAPGYQEDIEGRPFVGAAGQILEVLLRNIGLKREDVYIGNLVKHRPPRNRPPRKDEIDLCSSYLDRQIQIIRPRIIVTLGNYATQHLLSKTDLDVKGKTEVRGRSFRTEILGFPTVIIPTFHPAACLYNPQYKEDLEKDFRTIRDELNDCERF